MINPLDNNEFKHFLNFKKPAFGLIQITEPVKFDAAEFILEQGENYARDISLMSEEIPLEFYRGEHEKSDKPYQLPDGVIVDKLGMALDLLLQADREFGFEAEVEYTLERNGVVFVPAELNFEKRETDEKTYFNCSLVQNSKRALVKRRADIKIDAFANKDLDGNNIEPVQTFDILLKAKSIVQESSWTQNGEIEIFTNLISQFRLLKYNFINVNQSSGIENTLGFIGGISNQIDNFNYIEAANDIENLEIRFKIDAELRKDTGTINGSEIYFRWFISSTFSENFNSTIDIANGTLLNGSINNDTVYNVNEEFVINTFNNKPIFMPKGTKFWGYFVQEVFGIEFNGRSVFQIKSASISLKGNSKSIDTVIKGVRYIDLAKHALKVTNGFELENNDFEQGQKYGDLYAFSGNLIRQRDDVPFYFTLKERIENLLFRNYDIQINNNNAFCLHYRDFYANVDNGGFLMPTSENFKSSTYNEKYAVNSFEFGFKNFEKDRDEGNTLDGVHTQTQWLINNTKVTAVKKIDIEDIFDPFAIEVQRKLAVKETTALENDNKTFVIDTIPLAPGSKGGFTSNLKHQFNSDENTLKLLNDNSFSWELLGFGIGDTFEILQRRNIGIYTVLEIDKSIITLQFISGTLDFSGDVFTQVEYPYTNVLLTNRTSEGFSLIDNLSSGNNFSNLQYTIRRNLVDWEEYMSTCADFINQDISNTEFINNGELITQLEEGKVYKENGNIVLSDIAPAILTPRVYESEVIVDYDEMLDLINKYEQINTVGGFIRVQDSNGRIKKLYPKSLRYTWVTKVLNIIGEERKESDIVELNRQNNEIIINRVGYSKQILPEIFWEINNEYIVLFDINQINLINFTKFDNVKVNGIIYNTVEDLAQAMSKL